MEAIVFLSILSLIKPNQQKGGGSEDECPGLVGTEYQECLEDMVESYETKTLSYGRFMELQKQGKISPQSADELINTAYEYGNPILFKKSPISVPYHNYSINLFWIHKDKLSTEGGHLFGNNDEALQKYVINPITDWKDKQPQSQVNFWYDSAAVSPEQVKNTIKKIKYSNVKFRDIRTIPYVKENPPMFDLGVTVYYRVDLTKAVILDYVIRYDRKQYVVVADGDVVAVVREQLFDQPTMEKLKGLGFIFGTAGSAEMENSFMMMYNQPDSEKNQIKISGLDEPNPMNTFERHKLYVLDRAKKEFISKEGIVSDQDIFHLYGRNEFIMLLKIANRMKSGKTVQPSKLMIFPPSGFGSLGGYDEQKLTMLKNALAKPNEV